MALPEHIGASNAGQVRDEPLSAINLGAVTLIADMAATVSCDDAGADAIIRAWQRAAASGTELRLVVTARSVSRVLGLRGLDRQVSVYPSLEAAAAARLPAWRLACAGAGDQPPEGTGAVPVPAGGLLEALQDAVALVDGDGMIAAAASARLGDMFGYGAGELAGLPGRDPRARMPARGAPGAQGRLGAIAVGAGGRGRSTSRAAQGRNHVSRPGRPHPGHCRVRELTLVVIRDITETARPGDLAVLARDAAARQEHLQLLDSVIAALFRAGLSLQTPAGLSAGAARQRTEAVLGELDDIIRLVRGAVLAGRARPGPPPPRASGDAC